MREIERRFTMMEVRAITDQDDVRRMIGHGAVFNQLSLDLGGWKEIIMPGVFSDSLSDDVRSLFNHDMNLVLGRTISNTLEVREDDIGLHYNVSLPDTTYANDLHISASRGDVNQSSFGFRTLEDSWIEPGELDPLPVRRLIRAALIDVGPVTFPAYPTTSAHVRSIVNQYASDGQGTGEAARNRETVRRLFARRRRQLELLEKGAKYA